MRGEGRVEGLVTALPCIEDRLPGAACGGVCMMDLTATTRGHLKRSVSLWMDDSFPHPPWASRHCCCCWWWWWGGLELGSSREGFAMCPALLRLLMHW